MSVENEEKLTWWLFLYLLVGLAIFAVMMFLAITEHPEWMSGF